MMDAFWEEAYLGSMGALGGPANDCKKQGGVWDKKAKKCTLPEAGQTKQDVRKQIKQARKETRQENKKTVTTMPITPLQQRPIMTVTDIYSRAECRKGGGVWDAKHKVCGVPGTDLYTTKKDVRQQFKKAAQDRRLEKRQTRQDTRQAAKLAKQEIRQTAQIKKQQAKQAKQDAKQAVREARLACKAQGGRWRNKQCIVPQERVPVVIGPGVDPTVARQQACQAAGGSWQTNKCVFQAPPVDTTALAAACQSAGGVWGNNTCTYPQDDIPTDVINNGGSGGGSGGGGSWGGGGGGSWGGGSMWTDVPTGPIDYGEGAVIPGASFDVPGTEVPQMAMTECSQGFPLPATYSDRWGPMDVLQVYCGAQAQAATPQAAGIPGMPGMLPSTQDVVLEEMETMEW